MEDRIDENCPEVKKTLTLVEYIKDKTRAGQVDVLKDSVQQLEECFHQIDQLTINEKLIILSSLIAYFHEVSNYNKSVDYARQAVSLAKKAADINVDVLIDIYFKYSAVEQEYGQYAQARILLAQLLQVLETNNWEDKSIYGHLYYNLGKINIAEENFEAGIRQLEKALGLLKESVAHSNLLINKTVNLMAETYIKIKEFDKGIELYTKLLKAYKDAEEKELEVKTLLNIGEVYYYIDLMKAKKTVEQALEQLQHEYNNHHDKLRAIMMLAEIEENTGKFQNAVSYYQRSLNQLKNIHGQTRPMSAFIHSKIATLLFNNNELEQAKDYLEQGLKLTSDFPQMKLQIYSVLGKIYTAERRLNKANEYLQCLLDELAAHNNGKKAKGYGRVLQLMAYNFLDENNIEDALTCYQESIEIFEQIGNLSLIDKGVLCKTKQS